jgi:hypothetical protein
MEKYVLIFYLIDIHIYIAEIENSYEIGSTNYRCNPFASAFCLWAGSSFRHSKTATVPTPPVTTPQTETYNLKVS